MVDSRRKGARLEREAAHALNRQFGRIAARAARNGVDGAADLQVEGVSVEVKGRRKIGALRFMDQARSQARGQEVPAVLLREDGGEWHVLVRLTELEALVARLLAAEARA